jgi:hypothetical protein
MLPTLAVPVEPGKEGRVAVAWLAVEREAGEREAGEAPEIVRAEPEAWRVGGKRFDAAAPIT